LRKDEGDGGRWMEFMIRALNGVGRYHVGAYLGLYTGRERLGAWSYCSRRGEREALGLGSKGKYGGKMISMADECCKIEVENHDF